jgi:hypothetical protein
MITTTLDPISLNDVIDIENAPYIVEGEGQNALKIYFESEANRLEYSTHQSTAQMTWQD